jgi:hypothetical protein
LILIIIDRFITFGNRKDKMVQKRYDDSDKQRAIKREAPKRKKSTELGTCSLYISPPSLVYSFSYFCKDVSWYWSGDSKKGDKDVWIEYDHATALKLEKAFHRSAKKSKLDSERYIFLSFAPFMYSLF